MKNKLPALLLAVLLCFALAVRIYKIEDIPPSLYFDEVDSGYQARSLIETGKDYRGFLSPFYVQSFNDIRAPALAYLTVPTTYLFQSAEAQVRMPAAIAGTLIILITFGLILNWTNNFWKSYLVAFVFALSPWQIQFSRFSHEATIMLAIYLLGLWFFFRGLKKKSYIFVILGVISLSFAVYTYRTMSLFVPITLVSLFLIFKRPLLDFGWKKLFGLSFIAAAIIIPFLFATTASAPDVPRIVQLSITSDPEVPIWVQINREIDSRDRTNPAILHDISTISYLIHNKFTSWLDSFLNNYFQSFSTQFLFISGDSNRRHSIGQMGHLYLIDILALILGLFYLFKNLKKNEYRWLLAWFLLSPIAAAITVDGAHHASRLFIFSAPLLIIVGLGWWFILTGVRKLKYSKLIYIFLLLIFLGSFTHYLHRYFVHYPIESARYFGYGFKEAMLKIKEIEKDYKQIRMVSTNDPPMIYFLFWTKTPPTELQKYGTRFSEEINLGQPLDKYKVIEWPKNLKLHEISDFLQEDTLYLVTPTELPLDLRYKPPPSGVKLVDLIKYPDNEVSFYLIEKPRN